MREDKDELANKMQLLYDWIELRTQKREQVQEHRGLTAKNDPAFQRFMAKVLHV